MNFTSLSIFLLLIVFARSFPTEQHTVSSHIEHHTPDPQLHSANDGEEEEINETEYEEETEATETENHIEKRFTGNHHAPHQQKHKEEQNVHTPVKRSPTSHELEAEDPYEFMHEGLLHKRDTHEVEHKPLEHEHQQKAEEHHEHKHTDHVQKRSTHNEDDKHGKEDEPGHETHQPCKRNTDGTHTETIHDDHHPAKRNTHEAKSQEENKASVYLPEEEEEIPAEDEPKIEEHENAVGQTRQKRVNKAGSSHRTRTMNKNRGNSKAGQGEGEQSIDNPLAPPPLSNINVMS